MLAMYVTSLSSKLRYHKKHAKRYRQRRHYIYPTLLNHNHVLNRLMVFVFDIK